MDVVKNNTMQAVHDDDLDNLLKTLGKYEAFVENKCNCFFCKKIISKDNLYAIMPINGGIEFCCNRFLCLANIIGV